MQQTKKVFMWVLAIWRQTKKVLCESWQFENSFPNLPGFIAVSFYKPRRFMWVFAIWKTRSETFLVLENQFQTLPDYGLQFPIPGSFFWRQTKKVYVSPCYLENWFPNLLGFTKSVPKPSWFYKSVPNLPGFRKSVPKPSPIRDLQFPIAGRFFWRLKIIKHGILKHTALPTAAVSSKSPILWKWWQH